jgi:hypothetical protein
MDDVKHAHAARFLEIDPTSHVITPSQQLVRLAPTASPKDIDIPLISIDVRDRVHFETEPLAIQVPLPPVGTPLGLQLDFGETLCMSFTT